ncbi:MAG: hypothetical protein Barrevirus24_5 [Barrevirus sp.]|uniref:DUF3160 domain-containing protein n=1 Tax=Barrevirus sp. TaxID=2487763 RepID=A0A3G4ZQV0_9VIRU|nr:MAG: hypothetical protein Barrevirus24_5 [Barrevirus sp.]
MENQLQYLDLIQINPTEFNDSQKLKQDKLRAEKGDKAYYDMLWSDQHNDLKSTKSIDYRLTDEEVAKLKESGLLFKKNGQNSFAKHYLNLYNNDLPVMITSDSMLYALHKFYDNYLMNLETDVLINEFKDLCASMLKTLYQIVPNEQNREYLRDLEVFFLIPLTILSLQNELSESISTEVVTLFTPEVTRSLFKKCDENRRQNEINQGYPDVTSNYDRAFIRKAYKFYKFYEPNSHTDEYDVRRLVLSSPKLYAAVQAFKQPDVPSLSFKFGGKELFDTLIKKIYDKEHIVVPFCDTKIMIQGSQFKPRGHYTKSKELKNYFIAFTWLSKFDISIDREDNAKKQSDAIILSSLIAKIGEQNLDKLAKIQKFISLIIGEADGHTVTDFIKIINNIVPRDKTINESFNWILSNRETITNNFFENVFKYGQLTKFGDKALKPTTVSFSLIGKGNQIDNIIIQKLVDKNLVTDDGSVPMRKLPFIFDVLYTVFGNSSIKDKVDERMNDLKGVDGRDGYQYTEYLESLRKQCDQHKFSNTLYSQELIMLRTLSQNNKGDSFPFSTNSWLKKQAQTQLGHYAELRHDNVLYLEEASGGGCECMYPDLIVEPNVAFWNEMLTLIRMLKSLLPPKKKDTNNWRDELSDIDVLVNFETIIEKFIRFIGSGQKDEALKKELTCIVKITFQGSGPTRYDGWYVKLFHSDEICFEKTPEISTYFSSVNDDRGPGSVSHLGTGLPQLMYLNTDNKVFVGPVYTVYDFLTKENHRLNDEEWKKEHTNYQPLTF